MISELAFVVDPLLLIRSWETSYNCEIPGIGRVRLDNEDSHVRRK